MKNKNILLPLFILFSLTFFSCEEEEMEVISPHIGEWSIIQERNNYLNDSLFIEETQNLKMSIKEDGKAVVTVNTFLSTLEIPSYWVEDKTDTSMLIIQEFEDGRLWSNKFSIISNNGKSQEWFEEINSEATDGNRYKSKLWWYLTLEK